MRSLLGGAFAGVVLTASLVGVSYAGWRLFDFPFAPFDLFDWTTRALPGALATLAVEAMVRLTAALPFSSAVSAKAIEQLMAIGLVLATGAAMGAGLVAALRVSPEPAALPGVVLGAVLGGTLVFVEQDLNRLPSPGAALSGAWVFVTFLSWGALLGWICDRAALVDPSSPEIESPRELGRRRFLGRLGTIAGAVTAGGLALGAWFGQRRATAPGERWSASHAMPNAGASVAPVPGSRPEFTAIERHYRIDAVTRPPVLSGDRWRLRVGGLVEQSLQMTLEDLRRRVPLHQFVTLACISNPVGGDLVSTTRWTGVSLQQLLPEWRLLPTASHLKITSADGFSEVVALSTVAADPRVMLAYAWDDVPLPVEHGFPLRLYVPDLYGMKQPKWVDRIEALDHWEAGYWVARGWDREGRVRSTAAVDVAIVAPRAGGLNVQPTASIGGIAYAGARGISRVEVQIDDGAWVAANLRDPLSDTAWVVWRVDLPLKAGDHTVTVRSYERDGTAQSSAPHTKRVHL